MGIHISAFLECFHGIFETFIPFQVLFHPVPLFPWSLLFLFQLRQFFQIAPNILYLVVSVWLKRIWEYYLIRLVLELSAQLCRGERGMQSQIGSLKVLGNGGVSIWRPPALGVTVDGGSASLCCDSWISFISFFNTWLLLSSFSKIC